MNCQQRHNKNHYTWWKISDNTKQIKTFINPPRYSQFKYLSLGKLANKKYYKNTNKLCPNNSKWTNKNTKESNSFCTRKHTILSDDNSRCPDTQKFIT